MLNDPWKSRLIRYAHMNHGHSVHFATVTDVPKTILGKKFFKRNAMTRSMKWLDTLQGEVRQNELMSQHTSLCVGGPADYFIIPKNIEDIRTVLRNRGDLPVFVLGEGTNLLVADGGITGIALSVKEMFKTIQTPVFSRLTNGEEVASVRVGAGTKMSYLVKYLAKYSLTGIEDLVGIPGSVGGAVVMNAGADGTEIGDVIRNVTRISNEGEIETLSRDELTFQYRKTIFPTPGGIVIEAELKLKKGDHLEIQKAIDAHLDRRRRKQPLTLPNSGSVFKNPEGDTAGRLIEEAGLKGFSIGGAAVSIKHANFIVNQGEATAADIREIIETVQKVVKEKFGVDLETEVVLAGEWD